MCPLPHKVQSQKCLHCKNESVYCTLNSPNTYTKNKTVCVLRQNVCSKHFHFYSEVSQIGRDMQIMLPYYAMLQCQNPCPIMLNKNAYYAFKIIGNKINLL